MGASFLPGWEFIDTVKAAFMPEGMKTDTLSNSTRPYINKILQRFYVAWAL